MLLRKVHVDALRVLYHMQTKPSLKARLFGIYPTWQEVQDQLDLATYKANMHKAMMKAFGDLQRGGYLTRVDLLNTRVPISNFDGLSFPMDIFAFTDLGLRVAKRAYEANLPPRKPSLFQRLLGGQRLEQATA